MTAEMKGDETPEPTNLLSREQAPTTELNLSNNGIFFNAPRQSMQGGSEPQLAAHSPFLNGATSSASTTQASIIGQYSLQSQPEDSHVDGQFAATTQSRRASNDLFVISESRRSEESQLQVSQLIAFYYIELS